MKCRTSYSSERWKSRSRQAKFSTMCQQREVARQTNIREIERNVSRIYIYLLNTGIRLDFDFNYEGRKVGFGRTNWWRRRSIRGPTAQQPGNTRGRVLSRHNTTPPLLLVRKHQLRLRSRQAHVAVEYGSSLKALKLKQRDWHRR